MNRLLKMSVGSLLDRVKARNRFLFDLMSYGNVPYFENTLLIPFVPIMEEKVISVSHGS